MITKKPTDRGARVKVTFSVPSATGKVCVAGDFNGWDPTATPMRRRGQTRSVSVSLDPGRCYQFRYVDEGGRWFNDERADRYEHNEHGDTNGIIDLTGATGT
jgi:1,4-alpha-glucan branching enzyme